MDSKDLNLTSQPPHKKPIFPILMKVWMINYAVSCPWNILNVYRNHTRMIACLYTGLVFYPKSGRRWCTTPDDGRRGGWGRHKTDVMSDWEWRARKRGNMIENEESTGMEAWMGFAPLARRQDLTWGIHQSISTGRPNFCSWVVCDYWELFLQPGLFCLSDLPYFHCFARLAESHGRFL